MDISLDYAAPAEELRDYISVFYELRANIPHFEDMERADFAQLRFLFAGQGHYIFVDGVSQNDWPVTVMGPTTGNTLVRAKGPVHVFGCGILPAGWGAMINADASTFVNRVVDATSLLGDDIKPIFDEMRLAQNMAARVEIGNRLIVSLIQRRGDGCQGFTAIVDRWLESSFSPDVNELAEQLDISRRQVERRCRQLYGAPPKMLARKYRALRAAMILARGEANIAEVIGDNFYDQSHLIREIKQFTGVTPREWTTEAALLAKLTLKRAELAGEVKAIIYET